MTFGTTTPTAPAADQSGGTLYELTGVHKYFKKGANTIRALDGVDLTVTVGEFLAVQGPTGQGKSTLLSLLGGLDHPTSGRVAFGGHDLTTLHGNELADLRAQAFGYAFQTFNLIPTLSAEENVETALVPLHLSSPERRRPPARYWKSSASVIVVRICLQSFRVGSSSELPSPERSSSSPRCCWLMSRQETSTRTCAMKYSPCSKTFGEIVALPS